MKFFTCDACHYIFRSDNIPPSCPACSASSVIVQNDRGKKFKIPAIRISTETEMEQSRLADAEETAKKHSSGVLKASLVHQILNS